MSEQDNQEAVTKAFIVEKLMETMPELTTKKATALIEGVISEIKDTLSKGEDVKISGFGKFFLQNKNARKGRNPKTGETISISERRVLKFKASDALRQALNSNLTGGS